MSPHKSSTPSVIEQKPPTLQPKPEPKPRPSAKISLLYGLLMRCPVCGKGKVFSGYLKQVKACPACHESFAGISPDDGPTWLTILLSAHFIIMIMVVCESYPSLPLVVEIIILCVSTLIIVLGLLPLTKGVFIAALWLIKQKK